MNTTSKYINAAADLVKFWPSKVPGISSSGSFFDERTGQILPSGAKAYFGDSYYLLQSKPLGDPPTGLEVSEVLRTKTRLTCDMVSLQNSNQTVFRDNGQILSQVCNFLN